MIEKWMDDDESVTLQDKAFLWIKTPMTMNGIWALIYLTNKRFYVKDRLLRIRAAEFSLSSITSLTSDHKHLHVSGYFKNKPHTISIRLKDIDDSWEWMMRQKIKK